jgi:hypothetical protein
VPAFFFRDCLHWSCFSCPSIYLICSLCALPLDGHIQIYTQTTKIRLLTPGRTLETSTIHRSLSPSPPPPFLPSLVSSVCALVHLPEYLFSYLPIYQSVHLSICNSSSPFPSDPSPLISPLHSVISPRSTHPAIHSFIHPLLYPNITSICIYIYIYYF